MTERLYFHFSRSCSGKENGNPLQCSCLENPRDGGPWWAAIYGVSQSRTRLKQLSSSSSSSDVEHLFHMLPVCLQIFVYFPWRNDYQDFCPLPWSLVAFCSYLDTAAAAAAKSLQLCPTLCDPIDGSPPGSPVPGILQARTLEWVAISFSNAGK